MLITTKDTRKAVLGSSSSVSAWLRAGGSGAVQ